MKFRGSIGHRLFLAVISILGGHAAAHAQAKPFGIIDNSFLVEEAFNQDPGTFQSLFTWTRSETGAWEGSFTQEWPAPGITHQLSYTVPFAGGDGTSAHVGSAVLNYRYQASHEGPRHPAFAPRASVILPTGRSVDDTDRPGLEVNLPFSKQVGALYIHWNAGFRWLHDVPLGASDHANLTTPGLAGSVVWNARPLFNLMLESTLEFEDAVRVNFQTGRETIVTISPGFRGGWNFGEKQMVVGAAVPVTVAEGEPEVAFLTYFSWEMPFTATR